MVQSILRLKSIRTPLIWTFLLGVVLISCGKDDDPPPPPADKVALQATIATAQGLQDNTVEGTKPGQYEANSKAALTAALNASKSVEADAGATQAAVNSANQQLIAAIADYESHFIEEIAAENLIGFWKFNGNANDSSGNSNNGVVTVGHAFYGAGTPTLTPDRFARANMAYHFDKGGNINVPYKASLNTTQMTVSVWAKWSSTGRTVNPNSYYMLALNRWNGYKFQLQDIHLPVFTVKVDKPGGGTDIYDRAPDLGSEIPENTWRHLVATFTSGVMSFYIDGDLVKTWDVTTSRPVPGNAVTLTDPIDFVIGSDLPTSKYELTDDGTGRFFVDWGGFWTGDMDDVMFYNVALTGPQVKSIFTNQNTL